MAEVRAIGERYNNAELMSDCALLGYFPGRVLDATFGTGRFWKTYRPFNLTTNDLYGGITTDYTYDFRHFTGFRDDAFDSVVFDAPYKLNGTSTGLGPSSSDDGYGVGGRYSSVTAKMNLIHAGAYECGRVASQFLLVKCQDQVVSGNVVWQTRLIADRLECCSTFKLVDMLHVQGYRKQPEGRRQIHARRDYSTLLVFHKGTK